MTNPYNLRSEIQAEHFTETLFNLFSSFKASHFQSLSDSNWIVAPPAYKYLISVAYFVENSGSAVFKQHYFPTRCNSHDLSDHPRIKYLENISAKK